MGKLRYCEHCGHALTEASRFCENCGAPVLRQEPQGDLEQWQRTLRRVGEQPGRQGRPEERSRRAPEEGTRRPSEERPRRAPEEGTCKPLEERPRRMPEEGIRRPSEERPRRMPESGYRGASEERLRRQVEPPYAREEAARQEQMRRSRYQQEHLGGDWEQAWERNMEEEEEEKGFTPVQYVLLGLIGVLLIALLTFGAFWLIGRTQDRSAPRRQSGQTEQQQTGSGERKQTDAITILDGGGQEGTTVQTQAAQTEAVVKQTQAAQSEAPAAIHLDYSEFTVTLPASWKGKYGITQNQDGYTFYHQASRAEGYHGTLFTIEKYRDTSYKNLPNFKELGVGGGAAYIFTLPTDAQYPEQKEEVVKEYYELSKDLEQIRSEIQILVTGDGPKETEAVQILGEQNQQNEQSQQNAPGQQEGGAYILTDSSSRALTDEDVAGMSYDDMQMAINEIYARHGRKFASGSIQSYFESQPWYQGTVDADSFDESVFSTVEGQNIQFLLKKMGIQ